MPTAQSILLIFLLGLITSVTAFLLHLFQKSTKEILSLQRSFLDNERKLKRKLYETSILGELADKFGYSLSVERITDHIVGSLQELISYSVASYMLIKGSKITFRCNLVDNVSKSYTDSIRKSMLIDLNKLVHQDISKFEVEEFYVGNSLDSTGPGQPGSFFTIPLEISGEIVGMFNISSTQKTQWKGPEVTLLHNMISRTSNTITKLQRILAQERGKLEAMVESLIDGVFMVDKNLNLLVANPACKSLLKLSGKSSITIFDIVGAFDRDIAIERIISEVFKTKAPIEAKDIKIAGTYMTVTALPVEVEQGSMIVGVLLNDRTNAHELERLRSDFTAMMVHELRSPLTVMRGTADMVIKGAKKMESEKVQELLTNMRSSADDLLLIVNDILDEAKIEAGQFKLSKENSNINELLKEEVASYLTLAKAQDVKIITDLDTSISSFVFDPAKIRQVLNNLLSNALKFTPKGTITVVSKKEANVVTVSVIDTGEGIPSEVKPRLFTKFVQAEKSANNHGPSTGLGLVISKGIVESHGGKIWMEDSKPKGATFTFQLPA